MDHLHFTLWKIRKRRCPGKRIFRVLVLSSSNEYDQFVVSPMTIAYLYRTDRMKVFLPMISGWKAEVKCWHADLIHLNLDVKWTPVHEMRLLIS